jgi:excisionase family DNA binding protein
MVRAKGVLINPDDYLTLVDAAEYIGVTKQSLSQAWKHGKILGYQIGRTVILHKESVEKYKRTRKRGRPKKVEQSLK